MTTTHSSRLIRWEPLPEALSSIQQLLDQELASWRGTPYLLGACVKKYGVDCVRYCCAVADHLFGYKRVSDHYLPQDTCFHNKKSALGAMRKLRSCYAPLTPLRRSDAVQPGDVLVVGPTDGGPGHLMIVGNQLLWHMTKTGPCATGLLVPGEYELFRKYRFGDREQWLIRQPLTLQPRQ